MEKEKGLFHIDWEAYLKPNRLRQPEGLPGNVIGGKNPFESDLGRVVFCPAIRRMHDKTQVIPLTSGDTILTRLTHSMQVMCVAESISHNYTRSEKFRELYKEKTPDLDASISAVLRTASLLHDIGNPPFGHFGEVSIQNYFKKYLVDQHIITDRQALDFTQFDGNALGLRIVSKLQYTGTMDGLNLTYPTLAAYLKYPNSGAADKKYVGDHKHGIFFSEENLFDKIISNCNMKRIDGSVKRHPLSFLVEAADSICYGITDIEDGFNIQWYSFDGMIAAINSYIIKRVSSKPDGERILSPYLNKAGDIKSFSVEKLLGFNRFWNDNMQKDDKRLILDLRVAMIRYLSKVALKNFENHLEEIDQGTYSKELLKEDDLEVFAALSDFAKHKLISRRDVQELELTGNSVINGLLDILLRYAFSEDKKYRSKIKAIISKSRMEATIFEKKYAEELHKTFSEEDLWEFDIEQLDNYSKLRLIVDFVASMTDKYSVELYQKFAGMML